MKKLILLLCLITLLSACSDTGPMLKLLTPEETGITFNNEIFENEEYNILNLSYVYNGGGVSVGDFDNNGFQDIFFTGNMVDNHLYLNQGDMKFKNVTEVAGVASPGKWMYGSATVDINQDGWMDIYVCASIAGDDEVRRNMLFINKGLNDDGIPVFVDEAKTYRIDDSGHSSQAAFLDYDKDGDLDLYILSNSKVAGIPSTYRPKVNDGSSPNTDKLYRNNGDGTFSDISAEAGILKEGFGLGLAVLDANKDGASDIYVGNDYITNDLLYINDGSGKFEDKIDNAIDHQSRFSMGNDAADINNDGYPDIITLDMLPETNLRKKTVISGSGYIVYINDNRFGYTHQYVRNMLQLNNGNMTFSEIGQLAGVHQTEWSWSPLFVDIDNDGYRDLLVTNGFPKDITDNDFISFRKKAGPYTPEDQLLLQIPSVKIPNYIFRNKGDLTFEDVSADWGFTQPSFSNGAAFADFDNDGDLDYVVNNIADPAFLYENTLNQRKKDRPHYLRIKLKGPKGNHSALGAKVEISYGKGKKQYHEHSIYRGYVSTVEDFVHFGLGSEATVDKLEVIWPDGKLSMLEDVPADQLLELDYKDAAAREPVSQQTQNQLLSDVSQSLGIDYVHKEMDYIDYNTQRNIPHKFSQYGPSLAVGDINGDQLADFYAGGARAYEGAFFIQNPDGSFTQSGGTADQNKLGEDMGSLLFDADNDGDLDLYLVRGSFENPEGHESMQDQLFLNDGKGNFSLAKDALPVLTASGSCVRAADYDADGDLDLFVGGRVVVGAYPTAPRSYLLRNEGGRFTDQTATVSPELANLGMVTDAIWSDFNGDGKVDLVVTGEFLPVSFFANEDGKLKQKTDTGISSLTGWWNSIATADFDRDGDMDYVVGNLGDNNFYCATPDRPLRATASDFDSNGFIDVVLSCYLKADDGSMKPFPVHSWPELNAQSPIFRNRFEKYEEYGRTTIDQLFTPQEMENALVLEATHLSTSYIENLGNGQFQMHKLPKEVQFAPVNGILTMDLNEDGLTDILMVGNDYGNEVNNGQYDAFKGLALLGNGKGDFEVADYQQTGFFVNGDAKALVTLKGVDKAGYIIASQNRGPLKVFRLKGESQFLTAINPQDFIVRMSKKDGSTETLELHYGSGFLSQSSRQLMLPKDVQKIEITDFAGNSRTVEMADIL